MSAYQEAKEIYKSYGIDTEAVLETLKNIKISLHCWQGDDVGGFDNDGPLTGGIQTTGNYPGKARSPKELMKDIDKTLSLIPGTHRLNLHANYALFKNGEAVDRDSLQPLHFKPWVEFAKERDLGLDFNPTFFSHVKADPFTLSSIKDDIREFWINHGKACLRITDYFGEELNQESLMNIWIPDGYKDTPADRKGPRARFADSLDQILAIPYNKDRVFVSLESKVFGIGMESYTVGSAEFGLGYAASRGILPLFDNGHYHPTESVADKLSTALLFFDKIALHVTRGVRWDSDHVIRYDEETRDIAEAIIAGGPERIFIGTDYFDASINRIAAWVLGVRNLQKALLYALLKPDKEFKKLQDNEEFTELLVKQEEIKTLPLGAVWNEFCKRNEVPNDSDWYKEVENYEKEVLAKRV